MLLACIIIALAVLTVLTVVAVMGWLGMRQELHRTRVLLTSAASRAESAEAHLKRWTEQTCTPQEAARYCEEHPGQKIIFLSPAAAGGGSHESNSSSTEQTEADRAAGRAEKAAAPAPARGGSSRDAVAVEGDRDWPEVIGAE